MVVVIGVIFLTFASGVRADGPHDVAVSAPGVGCAGGVSANWLRAKNGSILTDYLADRPSIWQDGWKVYVKTSPCSGRFDWVTVARQNPTGQGGSGYWQTADLILTGTPMKCVREGSQCTKAAADAEAAVVRAQSAFLRYCCKDYSVWSNSQTGKMKIVVGKFGTGGDGWTFEDGPMCCEEAEAKSGITGACSGGTGGGTHGGGTRFGPMTDSTLTGTNLTFYRGTTPEQCQADCRANPQCKGFTLIKAGAYSPTDPPMCYLASAVTGSNNSSCCISGVKGAGGKTEPTDEIDLSGTWRGEVVYSQYIRITTIFVLTRESAGKWVGTAQDSKSATLLPVAFEHMGKGKLTYTFLYSRFNASKYGAEYKNRQITIKFGTGQPDLVVTKQ